MKEELLPYWDWNKNNIHPDEASNKLVWWLCSGCSKCGLQHSWQARSYDRYDTKNKKVRSCPYCINKNGKICKCQSISVLRPDVAKLWHPTRNKDLEARGITPETITIGSNQDVWWLCSKSKCIHPHEWITYPDRMRDRKDLCQFCCEYYNHSQSRCECSLDNISIATTHKDITDQWHPIKNKELENRGINIHTLTYGSKQKVWWLCPNSICHHPHEWEMSVRERTKHPKCYFCLGIKRFCECSSLKGLYPHIFKELDDIGVNPNELSKQAKKKVWWKCKNCYHRWKAIIGDRTRKYKPTGCPKCHQSGGEKMISSILEKKDIKYQIQYPIKAGNKNLRCDFYLPDHNAIIEYDGQQHFQIVEKFGGQEAFDETRMRDKLKTNYCWDNNIKLLRIHWRDLSKSDSLIDDLLDPSTVIIFSRNEYSYFFT